jgi:deoxyribodipyrimidine photo-lyase
MPASRLDSPAHGFRGKPVSMPRMYARTRPVTLIADSQSRQFPPTRAEALRRVAGFLPRAARYYAETRNSDFGPDSRANVSVLSPYLRYRLLSEAELVSAVLQRHSAEAAEKFIQEVLWRTYWKGWLQLRPGVWTRYLDSLAAARARLDTNAGLRSALAAAESGRSGIEGFDDWAQELVRTGYLHNHARMWFASIWIFTLGLPWALGADFFARHLLDADPASNTLGWRWVAGLQTPGKTYAASADNIAVHTDGRFQPKGLTRICVALREPALPAAQPLPSLPAPTADTPSLLLVHAEDLDPLGDLSGAQPWPWGDRARAFVDGGCADAAQRLRSSGLPVEAASMFEAEAVMDAALRVGARRVICAEAPVGPLADALDALSPALAAAGLPLLRIRRRWDSTFWPQAARGFFAFKAHIDEGLRAQGIGLG